MGEIEQSTLEAIHEAAIAEFLAKGFKSSSLRSIVKAAGVTTGAFYGYYESKAALFEALVGEHYDVFLGVFRKAQEGFAKLPIEEHPLSMEQYSGTCMKEMLIYAYRHLEAFKLILCGSEGTRFSDMVDEMVSIET